jgi:nucleotide-binding universal stress UspA family protein
VPGPSAEQLIRYLQRNEIVVEPMRVELDGRSTGETILATAQSLGCDLLIKGAYTQSRLRQMIFGGAFPDPAEQQWNMKIAAITSDAGGL